MGEFLISYADCNWNGKEVC